MEDDIGENTDDEADETSLGVTAINIGCCSWFGDCVGDDAAAAGCMAV